MEPNFELLFFCLACFMIGIYVGAIVTTHLVVDVANEVLPTFLNISLTDEGVRYVNMYGYKLKQYLR